MKTFQEVVGKKLDQIFCDVCGQNCMKENAHDNEHASLSATWGYDSRKDLIHHDIDLCEDCFDKTINFLKDLRKNAGGLLETFANNNPKCRVEIDPLEGSNYA